MNKNQTEIRAVEPKSLRRVFIRWFVGAALVAIAVDTAPAFRFISPLQSFLRPALDLTGLWQGEWPLFAPNPIVNNGWISAEFFQQGNSAPLLASDGKPLSWNSPIWSECNFVEKFYRFRHVNYFNRVAFRGQNVLDDLSDYVARKELGPEFRFVETIPNEGEPEGEPNQGNTRAIELRLSKNGLNIALPEDGNLPPPEEITWVYVGSGLASRKYAP